MESSDIKESPNAKTAGVRLGHRTAIFSFLLAICFELCAKLLSLGVLIAIAPQDAAISENTWQMLHSIIAIGRGLSWVGVGMALTGLIAWGISVKRKEISRAVVLALLLAAYILLWSCTTLLKGLS